MTSLEREPLLKRFSTSQSDPPNHTFPPQVGPLNINRSARHRILVGIWIAQFVSALNLSLIPTMLPSISSDFNGSNQASWLGTSYLLATCTFTPLYGRLCDVMGRRGAQHTAVLFAAIGTLACGFSNSMKLLIISRFVSGLGAGGIFITSAIITSDTYALESRGFIQSIGGIFYGAGMGLGGPVGGFITDMFGWRWAFLTQIPLFGISLALTGYNLYYVTPGTGKNTREILGRIDYGGTVTLMGTIGSTLYFLSKRYNEDVAWSNPSVWGSLASAIIFLNLFLFIEVFIAVEPVFPPSLFTQKVPVLVGCSNALVAVCNLSISYFLPFWFQTVALSSASTAGLHMLPNSLCLSMGSLFAGWMMRKTGQYKVLNMIFGTFPLVTTILLTQMRENSSQAHQWLSIIPMGIGNAVVIQTMYVALVANLPENQIAVGAGFAQLLRGLGQVGGLAVASAVFQSRLETELRVHIHSPDAEQIIKRIRYSSRHVVDLSLDLQRVARDAYAGSLKSVFTLAVWASFLAYIIRLPIPDCNLADPTAGFRVRKDDISSRCGSESGYETDDGNKGGVRR